MAYTFNAPCDHCGRNHTVGAQAIYCDYYSGVMSPSVGTDEQVKIAEEFERSDPAEALAIGAALDDRARA